MNTRKMSTAPITIDVRQNGNAPPVCRIATVWSLLAALLAFGCGGCSTPTLRDLHRQAEVAAENRVSISAGYARVPREAEIRTAPAVLSLLHGELDEATIVHIALINNPGLAIEYAKVGIARSDVLRARRVSNPTVEASARFGDDHNDSVDVKIVQDIVDLVFLPRRRVVAERSLDAAKDRLTSRIMGVLREARSDLIEYRTVLVLLEAKQEIADCREAAVDVAQRMVKAGNMTVLDLAAFEQRHHAAQFELMALRIDSRNKREAVSRVMGLHEDTDWKVKATGADVADAMIIPAESADIKALTASLELSAQRSEIVALTKQRGIEETRAYLPEIKVGVDSERDSDGAWAVGPALILSIPLFDRGQAGIAAVDSQMQGSWNRYAQTAVAIASACRMARTRLDTLQQSLRTQRENVIPLRTKILQETLLQYNGMLVGVFDLLRAKEQAVEAQAHLAELTRDYRLAHLDLQLLLAGGEVAASPEARTGAPVQADSGRDRH